MKKILLCFSIFALTAFNFADRPFCSSATVNFERFVVEMQSFIAYAKTESFRGGKCNVYLAKFTDNNGIEPCVTFDYIFDTLKPISELQSFDRYIFIDSNLVLLSFEDHFLEKYDFQDTTINHLENFSLVTDRLYDGAFFSNTPVWVVSFGNEVTTVKKYWSRWAVPQNLTIFAIPNKGVIREIDKSEFKQKKGKRTN